MVHTCTYTGKSIQERGNYACQEEIFLLPQYLILWSALEYKESPLASGNSQAFVAPVSLNDEISLRDQFFSKN